MKKPKQYYRMLNLGVFPYDILICQGMTLQEALKHVDKKFKIEIAKDDIELAVQEKRVGKMLHLSGHQTIVWLKYPPVTPSSIGTLAHETTHAIVQIYNSMGVPFNADNDEVLAYGIEYVVGSVLKDFARKR